MIWQVEWLDSAAKEFRKIDQSTQKKILRFLRERIATKEDPRRFGKPLRGNLKGLWRYRLGDYRFVCRIEQERLVVLVIRVCASSGYL